jgi:hypothetical protein
MKIEIHVYHHFITQENDPALVQALADKLRASNERLSTAIATNAAALQGSSPSTPKEIKDADHPAT